MKRILFIAALLLAGLAACNQKENPGEQAEAKAPEVSFSIPEETMTVTVGDAVAFSATIKAGGNVSTEWWVDDVKVAATPSVTWRFNVVGTSIVKFKAENALGKVEKTYTVTVVGEPLEVSYSIEDEAINAVVGTSVDIAVTIVSGDKGTVHSWTLDGAEAGSGLVFSKTFTLEEIGVHTLVYEAVNTDGMGVTKTWTITVSDLPLEVTFSPEKTELEAMVGDNLTFSATIVHGSTGAAYAWKAGETTLGTEASLKYACAAEGTVTLTGTVTNAVGESAEKTWTITIGPKVDTGAYMLLDAETMTELPAATVLWFNDKAGSLADNPVPTSTVNSGTKVFKNDMASATWATSGLVKIYTNEIVESSVRYKYKTVRIKVYLGNNDYLPFMVLPINGDKASRPTKVNGTDFYPNHSQDLWNSLVKHDDWNVLEYNIETGNFQNVAATLADVSQIQFRFFVNYSNSNYPNPLSETNTHIVYFDDVEMLE